MKDSLSTRILALAKWASSFLQLTFPELTAGPGSVEGWCTDPAAWVWSELSVREDGQARLGEFWSGCSCWEPDAQMIIKGATAPLGNREAVGEGILSG